MLTSLHELARLDVDQRQEEIVPILREYLPKLGLLGEEAEIIMGMWTECLWEGMVDICTQVALQTFLDDRSITLNAICEKPTQLLRDDIIQGDSKVFWRIYLHILQRAIWGHRRIQPRLNNDPFEIDFINFIFKYAHTSKDDDCRRIIISFIHQLFLENVILIKNFHTTAYPIEMIPWMVEFAPSTRTINWRNLYYCVDVLLESLPASINSSDTFQPFKCILGVTLCNKYPLQSSQELCKSIIGHCERFGEASANVATECVTIIVEALRAFPTLMADAAPILARWSVTFADDPEFNKTTLGAATQLAEITVAVQLPIYQRASILTNKEG